MAKNKKITLIVEIFCIIAVSLFVRILTNATLFVGDINMIDEGQLGAWANHMLHGKKLFADIYSTYGPLYVYPLYWLFSFFTPSVFIIRAFLLFGAIVGVLATLWISYFVGLTRVYRFILIVIFATLPIVILRQGVGLLTLCTFFQGMKRKNPLWFFITGVLLIITHLISLEIGIYTLVTLMVLVILELSTRRMHFFPQIAFFLIGAIISSATFASIASIGGWLYPYIEVQRDLLTLQGVNIFNGTNFPNALSLFPRDVTVSSLVHYLVSKEMLLYWTGLFTISILLAFFLRIILRIHTLVDDVLFGVAVFGMLLYTVVLTRHGVGHYFFILVTVVILGLSVLERSVAYAKSSHTRLARIFMVVSILFYAGFIIRLYLIQRVNLATAFSLFTGSKTNASPLQRVGPVRISQTQASQMRQIQDYITPKTGREDYIFFFSNSAMMYMLLDRVNPTRYDLPFIANKLEKRLELVSSLQKNPPTFILEDTRDWAVDGISNRQRLPEVVSFIKKQYKRVKRVGSYDVYYLTHQRLRKSKEPISE